MKNVIAQTLPLMRRFARAIAGEQAGGDHCVKLALETVLRQQPTAAEAKGALYRALVGCLEEHESSRAEPDETAADAAIVDQRIGMIGLRPRMVLVLSMLEGMPLEDIAAMLEVRLPDVQHWLTEAKAAMRDQRPTRILVIEDEPIIALDIAGIVQRNGHQVVGIATTLDEAVTLAEQHRPELILADIQLADDSSGVDAVMQILERQDVPTIFITAFPERLLTGERPEPTFLITKPFDADTLNVSISQAIAAHDR